jgi:hypothetical protein
MEDSTQIPQHPGKAIWITLAAAAIAGAGVLFWIQQRDLERAAEVSPPPPAEKGPAEPQEMVEAISSDPSFRSWTAKGDVVQRWTVVTVDLANDAPPRRLLDFLAPKGDFAVVKKGDRYFIDPASYKRYDGLAAAINSIDPDEAVAAYRKLHDVLENAYHALGYPGSTLDWVTSRAMQHLDLGNVLEGDVEVVPGKKKGIFLFADPRLEKLGAVEKQFLRMGPRNSRIMLAKLHEIARQIPLSTP